VSASPVRRILIVNLTRFGDLLQTSPTVAALRERHPEATITLLAEKNFAEVCEGIPGIDRVVRAELDAIGNQILEGGTALVDAYRAVERQVHDLRAERFDLACNFSSSRMTAVFMGLLGIPDVRGWSMTPDGFRVILHPWARLFATMCLNRRVAPFNLVDYYRAMAGFGGAVGRLQYDVPPAAQEAADALLGAAGVAADDSLVALQLGASRPIRQWPVEAFGAVARALAAAGHRLGVVGGGGDRPLAAAVANAAGTPVVDACGRTRVGELGGLLRRTRLLITGDTGPMHMAVAVGTPVLGLFFGPALPFDTGPYGPDHLALHTGAPCAPCEHSVQCLDPFCRTEIVPALVAETAVARLADDWGALDRLARDAGSVRLYRSSFDAYGLHRCELLGGRPARPEDRLRAAYRAAFLSLLVGAPPPASGAGDPSAFIALAALAREGAAVADRLDREARRPAGDLGVIERLGRESTVLDESLQRHGATHPDTAALVQMFTFGKENLEGEDVAALATATGQLYRDLGRGAELMATALGGDDRRSHKEEAHARLDQ
jgi:ADP-heptose:LPS heptosyltransferase